MMQGLARSLGFLEQNEIHLIHEESLYLLETYGIKVDDPMVRDELAQRGCQVEGLRVRIPADLIQEVLTQIKKEVIVSRTSGRKTEIKPGQVVTHSTGGIPSILDPSGLRRSATLADFQQITRLMDHLDQLDMPCALVYPNDVPSAVSQIVQTEQLLRYTQKPIYGPGISTPGEAKYVVELFKVYAHPGADLGEAPIGVVGISPESPLHFPKVITDTMKVIISAGIPTVMLSGPVAGISAPVTIAGGLAQMNAEMLAFATIAYTINPKTVLIYGSRLNFPAMKSGNSIWGLPEIGIGAAAAVQLAGYYGFLSDVYGLSCTSCTYDNQNGYEKGINAVLPMLAGATMLSGFGSMASLMVASCEQLVIDNETFALLRKVRRGIEVNEDTLARGTTADAMAGKSFLGHRHTSKHVRAGEIFKPQVGLDGIWGDWERSGKNDIRTTAQERVNRILDNDNYEPIPAEVDKEVKRIVEAAKKELVKN